MSPGSMYSFIRKIAVNGALAFRLREPAHRVDEIRLDTVEVVFRLGVDDAEDGVGVGPAADVGDAPVVARDGDVLRLLFPGGHFRRGRRLRERNRRRTSNENEAE